ncbi:MAG: YceI family protein [Terricaulis sp.]
MRALVFAFALLTATAAHAEDRFTLDTAHTQVAFSISRMGFTHILGRFDETAGEVVLDSATPANSSVHAVIQVASITSGNATRDEHLRGDRWLNAAQFPTIEFQSTSVRVLGENHAEVTGNLTIHGVTAPAVLDVRLNQTGPGFNGGTLAGFSATTTITRSTFGITGGIPAIGDEVTIQIEALGAKQ